MLHCADRCCPRYFRLGLGFRIALDFPIGLGSGAGLGCRAHQRLRSSRAIAVKNALDPAVPACGNREERRQEPRGELDRGHDYAATSHSAPEHRACSCSLLCGRRPTGKRGGASMGSDRHHSIRAHCAFPLPGDRLRPRHEFQGTPVASGAAQLAGSRKLRDACGARRFRSIRGSGPAVDHHCRKLNRWNLADQRCDASGSDQVEMRIGDLPGARGQHGVTRRPDSRDRHHPSIC